MGMQLTKWERTLLREGAQLVCDGHHRQYVLNGERFTIGRAKRMTPCQEHTFITKLRRAMRKGKVQA